MIGTYNYYKEELERVTYKGEYLPTITISDQTGNKTKVMTLNAECIDEVLKYLNELKAQIK